MIIQNQLMATFGSVIFKTMAYKVNMERLFEIAKPRNEKAHKEFLEKYATETNTPDGSGAQSDVR